MSIKITIGVCVKNGEDKIKAAFNSIAIQDYPHSNLKVVIVDNGSTDGTLSLAKKFAEQIDIKTFVTSSKGKGLGETRQIVVCNAEGDYIVWVDDDLVLQKNFVRSQFEFMENRPHVGAAKAVAVQPATTNIIGVIDNLNLVSSTLSNPETIGTGGSIFRLKALKQVGGFDTEVRGAGEDLDVSKRISAAGWLLATNKSAKLHKACPPKNINQLWRRNFWYGYGNHFLFQKYRDVRIPKEYLLPFFLWGGLKISCLIYRKNQDKKMLFFPSLYFFGEFAQIMGFILGNIQQYGPKVNSRRKTSS